MIEDRSLKSIVILSARSLFADGVASQLRQAAKDLELTVLDPKQPEAIDQIVDARPSVIIMDGGDNELARLCPLSYLVSMLPSVKIIWLKPQQDVVQLVTSEQRIATQVSDLIEMINQP